MSDNGVLLRGLDGSNPLAFLAALGTLRTLSQTLPKETVRIRWEQADGAWRPRVYCSLENDTNAMVALIGESLDAVTPTLKLDKRLPFSASKLRDSLLQAVRDNNWVSAAWLACLGTEAITDDEVFADTDLRMVRSGDSAGQGMLHYACLVAGQTTRDDLQQSLFQRWVYSHRGSSFRWDPNEDAQYALQAGDPSKVGICSVVGANRLAIEALPLLPVFAVRKTAITLGFGAVMKPSGREFRWPIWEHPIPVSIVHSLMGLRSINTSPVAWDQIRGTGIVAIFSCTQYKPNQYYSNFRPAVPL
jgi:hypothetical protein